MTTTFLTGYLALGTSTTGLAFVEEVGTGYARVAVTIDHASANRSTNHASATFTASDTDWVDVSQFAVYAASTGGTPLFWWNRGRSTAVANTKTFVVAAGAFNLLFVDSFYRTGSSSTWAIGDVVGHDSGSHSITVGAAFGVSSGAYRANAKSAGSGTQIGYIIGANMNSTADQAITLLVPGGSSFIVRKIVANNASRSLDTAVGGVYPAASKAGTALVANTQVYSALTDGTKYVDLTLAAGVASVVAASPLYLALTTAQGAAATADVHVYGEVVL